MPRSSPRSSAACFATFGRPHQQGNGPRPCGPVRELAGDARSAWASTTLCHTTGVSPRRTRATIGAGSRLGFGAAAPARRLRHPNWPIARDRGSSANCQPAPPASEGVARALTIAGPSAVCSTRPGNRDERALAIRPRFDLALCPASAAYPAPRSAASQPGSSADAQTGARLMRSSR